MGLAAVCNQAWKPDRVAGISKPQAGNLIGAEPAQRIVLLRRGIRWLPGPPSHEEPVSTKIRISEIYLHRPPFRDLDGNLLATLAPNSVQRVFARLDVSANQVPTVRVPPTFGMPVT
jgi:hypothetical protein